MKRLTEFVSYADAQQQFSGEKLWELFDGNRDAFNIAHECVDRHAATGRDALIVANAAGGDEVITYAELSADSGRFANWLAERGVRPARVLYLGNDVNDLPCFAQVGWPVAVASAQPRVRAAARSVTTVPGGRGAVREIASWILREDQL